MERLRRLSNPDKARVKRVLSRLLAQREEIRFACLLGSFLERRDIRDLDLAVWVDFAKLPPDGVLEYELRLSAWLEPEVRLPVDVKVLNDAPLSFRYAATGGISLLVRDEEEWFSFREQTWRDYFDFAPLANAMLADLLSPEGQ